MGISTNQVLPRFLRHALRPIAAFCVRRGLKVQDMVLAAKQAFLDAAREELAATEVAPSASRLSIMTGLQRKDISRLNDSAQPARDSLHFLMKIVGQWRHDKRYLDVHGEPRALAVEGEESEFGKLVYSISKDLSPYTALFELERIGAVTRSEKSVTLNVSALNPGRDVEAGLDILADDIEHLVAAVDANLFASSELPQLHIRTQYDNICTESVPHIHRWLLEKGASFHSELRNYLSQHDKDLNPLLHNKPGGAKIAVGSFSDIAIPKPLRSDKEGQ